MDLHIERQVQLKNKQVSSEEGRRTGVYRGEAGVWGEVNWPCWLHKLFWAILDLACSYVNYTWLVAGASSKGVTRQQLVSWSNQEVRRSPRVGNGYDGIF